MVFVARQLEFNAATKYFCLNRSVDQKRLSQAGMLAINRLYCIIGRRKPLLNS